MNKIVVAIPHSHSWLWTQICVSCLRRFPPKADNCICEIVVVDNSPWSPAIRGLTDTILGHSSSHHSPQFSITIIPNHKSNRFHASALDCIVEDFSFDYLMALETDVMVLRDGWLQWFMDMMRPTDYAVGMWHHEQFVNPSCTMYRGNVLRDMMDWCKTGAPQNELRWGPQFSHTAPLDNNLPLSENPVAVLNNLKGWIGGPFAEKRGWPLGTVLTEQPSGQLKGPGWYEPGQQLHHWAVDQGHTYTVCPTITTSIEGVPVQSIYGRWGEHEIIPRPLPTCRMGVGENGIDPRRQLEATELFDSGAFAVHLWGGTRALDILKHPVTCEFVKANTPGWLAREARFWMDTVPQSVRHDTTELIRKYGWHYTGQGTPDVTDRDRAAAEFVRECYAMGGVLW